MKKIHIGFSVLMCLLMLVGCANSDVRKLAKSLSKDTTEWSRDSRITHIPFKYIDHRIVMPVSLNGSKNLDFVLDTGATASALLESHNTGDLGLTSQGQTAISGGGTGENSKASFIHNVDIGAGDVILKNKTILDSKLANSPLFQSLDDVYFDGIVGYDLFNYLIVEINHDQSVITLRDPHGFESVANEMLRDGWVKVPLDVVKRTIFVKSKVLLKGQSEPIELKLLLDTGSNGGLALSPNTHEKIALPEQYYSSKGIGFSGDFETLVGLVSHIDLGGFQVNELTSTFSDNAVISSHRTLGSHGAIGMPVFSKFNVVFNYQDGYMLIKPNSQFNTPIRADRSGLRMYVHKDGYIVKLIAEGSAAEQSNLQLGDVIVSFNNEPATAEKMVNFRQLLTSTADKINICWMRESKQYCEDLKLMDRL